MTRDRWVSIFAALGIKIPPQKKHGQCPVCAGRDRFRMDDKDGRGTWYCNQCTSKAGDGFSLVMKVLKIDFKEAVKVIRGIVGSCDITIRQPEATISRETLRKIFTESMPICKGDPVTKYLKNRGLSVLSDKLRYHPECYEPETKEKLPCMLATVSLPDGEAVTMHRTYLTLDGEKADIENPKKLLPALQPISGSAIRLFSSSEQMIYLCEGIETALAVKEMTNRPVWAAGNSVLMEKFEPPKELKYVGIWCDNDANFTGQRAAYILANRLVIQNKIEIEVFVPKNTGDWLDVFNQKRIGEK